MNHVQLATLGIALSGLISAPTLSAPPKAVIGDCGADTKSLSKTVRPGDDFYHYVN